jgi:NADH-quinone oxidoreductase subunit N
VIAAVLAVVPALGRSGLGFAQVDRIDTPPVDWGALAPQLILIGGAFVLLAVAALSRKRPIRGTYTLFTIVVGGLALVAARVQWSDLQDRGPIEVLGRPGAVVIDGFAVFVTILICVAVVLGALLADEYLRREDLEGPEFYVLMMLSAAGGIIMAVANDLIVLFLGLEVLSISLYVLAGFHSRRAASQEASLKYFILGSFSSALFLYGIALTYGATGSTNLPEIAQFLRTNVIASNGVLLGGMGLILVGLGFKIAAVPFHMWTPDVYQGSPTPATGFMAAAAKCAGFAGLLRVFFSAFHLYGSDWRPLVWVLAVLTIVVGSVLAVVQTDVKRMLAYSSISHAGYVLIGLQAGTERGVAGSLFYLLAYTFMILGSFAIVTVVGGRGDSHHDLDDYRGMSQRRPVLALAFTVLLLAQAGVPLTSGFLAKFYVLGAAVAAHSYALAIIGMLGAVISFFFYLRVIVLMYMTPPLGEEEVDTHGGDVVVVAPHRRLPVPIGISAAVLVAIGFTIAIGVVPDPVADFARHATLLLA